MNDFELKNKILFDKYYLPFMKIGIVICIIGGLYLIIFDNSDKNWLDEICPGFKGRVIYKVYKPRRGYCIYFVKLDNNKDTLDNGVLSSELFNNVKIGDTIYKIPKKNECIIIKSGDSLKVKYSDYQFGSPIFRKCD